MTLTKLGKHITECKFFNSDNKLGEESIVGISTQKMMIATKADLNGVSFKSYKLLPPRYFAYVADTSRRGDKMSLCFNDTEKTFLVSSISIVFFVNNEKELSSDYLFMYFNRPEFDRYTRFNSWGSARETFDWSEMCDIDIELPSKDIQQKYVDVYKAMVANQQNYERGLDDLKLVCDAYIEDLRRKMPCEPIGQYLVEQTNKVANSNSEYTVDSIMGISSIDKCFMKTKADTNNLSISTYKIAKPNDFSFNPNTARMGDRIPIAYNNSENDYLVSAIYPVFSVDETKLIPEYLMMWFKRSEFDRYARFHSWGSARETFDWPDMCNVEIPAPDTKIQKDIVNIYKTYISRIKINEKLKDQIKDICPILIKGSIEEAQKEA